MTRARVLAPAMIVLALVGLAGCATNSDVEALRSHPHREVLPFVEEVSLGDRVLYLFAGGSMANLTAGSGDSLNAFDVTIAVLVAGIGHITGPGSLERPGLHLLPRPAWEEAVAPR